jgi:adenosine deaminase
MPAVTAAVVRPVADSAASVAANSAADPVVSLIARMPKAELHLHLDGSLRPETALDLARERGLDDGMSLQQMRSRLTAPPRCESQFELLRAFDLPIALMQDAEALTRITHELVQDVADDRTRYVEIRWAPALHTERGLSLRDGIAAVVAGAAAGARSTGVVVRLIAVALRSHAPERNREMAEEAARFIGDGLTGFDCAGQEERFPDPLLHAAAFDVARTAGLGITCHAGEWGGAPQIWRALEVRPTRIAHGQGAIDDPGLMAELIAGEVTLDLCPTSNVQAGIVASVAEHPIARLFRFGVPTTLSTDDRTVSDLTLVREYRNVVDEVGMALPELWAMNRHALAVAFLQDDELLRARLLAEFDAFAASEAALTANPA